MQQQKIPIVDGELTLIEGWLGPDEAGRYLDALENEITWEQSTIRIMGRDVRIPRLNAWYGDPGANYTYSGTTFEALPWTPTLEKMRSRIEKTVGESFNSVLANLYRSGEDGMGWHADDEPELGRNPLIASVSLGDTRKFSLKHRRRKDIDPVYLWLQPGSLLVMSGATQHHWRHSVPKTKKPVGTRINLTFRQIIG